MTFSVGCTRCCSSCRPSPETNEQQDPRKYDFCVIRVGFLGPHGTFAEEAVLTQPDLADQELQPRRSVPDVISAIERDEVDIGLVPIENSIEGTVTVTLDTLAFDTDLLIQREIDDPTAALDAFVEEAVRPRVEYIASIVVEMIGGEPTDPDVLRCVGSILSQAVVYVRRNPVAERLGFSFTGSPADIDEAARHIAAFSLAGVRAVAVQRA